MSTSSVTPTAGTVTRTPWVTFAGVMAIIAGVANLIWGWAALVQNNVNEAAAPVLGALITGPLEFWGWVSIVWGLVMFGAAWLLLAHHEAGRPVGITLAAISAVFWLYAMPAFPLYALAAIVIDVVIIYGLSVHWHATA